MGVITVSGVPQMNVTDYSISMDTPSLDPTSSTGGTGSMSYSTDKDLNAPTLRAKALTITDTSYGAVSGTISGIRQTDRVQTIAADTVLAVFNADMTIPPFSGTLNAGLSALFTLVNNAASGVPVLPVRGTVTGGTASVILPGAKMNAWLYLKQLCQKYKLYPSIAANGTTVNFVSNLPTTPTDDRYLNSESISIDDSQVGKAIEVAYYQSKTLATNTEVYPPNGTYQGATVIQVGSGETVVTDVQLNAWVSSINQPTCMDLVTNTSYTGTNGVYSVAGSDGLGVKATEWVGRGGQLSVALTPDPSIVRVTVVAPPADKLAGVDGLDRLAPYSIAMTSGNLYNSLHLTGKGVSFERQTVTIQTGCTLARTGDAVAFTCDSPFTSTLGDAYDIGLRAAQAYAGPSYTIDRVERGAPTTALGTWLSRKISKPDVTFTLESAVFGPDSVRETGIAYTQIADFNTVWAGQTFATFNSNRGSIKFMEYAVTPLRKN